MGTSDFDPGGLTVIILSGEFAGEEGTCLGPVPDQPDLWAVSPLSSDRILNLRFEEGFGVVLNPDQEPGRN